MSHPAQRHDPFHPAQRHDPVRRRFLIALGVVLAIMFLAALTSGGDDSGYSGYDDPARSGSGSGGGTSFYDGGWITTTEDGDVFYSDTNGNGFSTGG